MSQLGDVSLYSGSCVKHMCCDLLLRDLSQARCKLSSWNMGPKVTGPDCAVCAHVALVLKHSSDSCTVVTPRHQGTLVFESALGMTCSPWPKVYARSSWSWTNKLLIHRYKSGKRESPGSSKWTVLNLVDSIGLWWVVLTSNKVSSRYSLMYTNSVALCLSPSSTSTLLFRPVFIEKLCLCTVDLDNIVELMPHLPRPLSFLVSVSWFRT